MKLKQISLSKVLKLELPPLLNDVIRIIEKHNPEHLYLESSVRLLKEKQQLADLLEVPRKAHPLTKEIQHLREKELQCAGAISSHMQFIVRVDIDSMRHASSIASPVVKRFLNGIRKNNDSVTNQIIKQFFDHLKKTPEVENALIDLGLKPFVDELQKVNDEKIKLTSLRITKPKPRVNSKLIQKEIQNDIRFVFETIDVHNLYKEKPNYDPLIHELNILLTRYSIIINTRRTHNKKRTVTKTEKSHISMTTETTPLLLPHIIEDSKLRDMEKT